jgi:hypothetical protein
LGAGGRAFKSPRPDHIESTVEVVKAELGRALPILDPEGIEVAVHPHEQCGGRVVRRGARRLAGLDPAADEILGKLSETPARVVEFFGLLTASCEKDLAESGGAGRIGLQENIDSARNRFEAAYEREACAIATELPRD